MKLSQLTLEQKIRLLAELDGYKFRETTNKGFYTLTIHKEAWERCSASTLEVCISYCPHYLTSYDAIIPLVQKLPELHYQKFCDLLIYSSALGSKRMLGESPSQLCDAALVATGKAEL